MIRRAIGLSLLVLLAPADATARVSAPERVQRLDAVVRDGVRYGVTCARACQVRARLTLAPHSARRLGAAAAASRVRRLAAGESATLTVRPPRSLQRTGAAWTSATVVTTIRDAKGVRTLRHPIVLGDAEAGGLPIASLMKGVAGGVADGVEDAIGEEVVGWALTSLGLESDPSEAIVDALEEIEGTLLAMENELASIADILKKGNCQAAAATAAVHDALTAIDVWVGRGASPTVGSYLDLSQRAKSGDDVTGGLNKLFDAVLNGDGNSGGRNLAYLLVGLDDALRAQGNAQQVITACGQLVYPVDATGAIPEWDDRAYFQQLTNIIGYYAEYQARAALVLAEAYHWKALNAWIAAVGKDAAKQLAPEDVPQICNKASGDVKQACDDAAVQFNNIRTNMRAQFGEAGAPYSTGTPGVSNPSFLYDKSEPKVQLHNPTGFVWVKDIDDFFTRGGYSSACRASTSKSPCGPGVGYYDHATFEVYGGAGKLSYGGNGGYTTWKPAPQQAWAALIARWSGSKTTLGELLTDTHGFAAGAATPRVYFTGDVSRNQYVFSNDYELRFAPLALACFVVTPMNKGNSAQPFCDHHLSKLVEPWADHVNSKHPCLTLKNITHGTLDDAGIEAPFFSFLFNMQPVTCDSPGHPNAWTFYGGPPGWLLQYQVWSSYFHADSGAISVARSDQQGQYHWPVFEVADAQCTAEPATGAVRSPYALNGNTTRSESDSTPVRIPRLCGKDFDAWFEKWIAPPAAVQAAPQVTVPPQVVTEVPPGTTAGLAPHELTREAAFAHRVSAVDREDGRVGVSCFPDSGQPFQLGTTTVLCRARDRAGATSDSLFRVHTRYPFRFTGALARRPLRVAAGAAVPVAFSLGGNRGPAAIVDGPVASRVNCRTGASLGGARPVGGLRYARGAYQTLWQTSRRWSGQCRELAVELADGTRRTARVRFR